MHQCFTFLLSLLCTAGLVKAQPGFQKLNEFSHNQWRYSFYTASYADSNRIIGIGFVNRDEPLLSGTLFTTTFIAAQDYSGNLLWDHKLKFVDPSFYGQETFINCLLKTSNEQYALGANAYDTINNRMRPFIYWFDTNGDSVNFAILPVLSDSTYNLLYAIGKDVTGNILATGTYQNKENLADTFGIWLAKFSEGGQFLWKSVVIDTSMHGDIPAVFEAIAGNSVSQYLVVGYQNPIDTVHDTRNAIWKFDSSGHLLWRKHIPRLYNSLSDFYIVQPFFDIVKANNGSGYYFAAVAPKTSGNPSFASRGVYHIGKMDENGNVVWANTYERDNNHDDAPRSLLQKPSGDLLINGNSFNQSQIINASALLLLDSLGNVKWYKTYQYAENCTNQPNQILYSLNLSPSGGIVRSGGLGQDNPQPCWDSTGTYSLLVYTDSLGRLNPYDTVTIPIVAAPAQYGPVGIAEPVLRTTDFEVYPNPATNKVQLKLKNLKGNAINTIATIYDFTGKIIWRQHLKDAITTFDISRYSQGIYLIKLQQYGMDAGAVKVVKQ